MGCINAKNQKKESFTVPSLPFKSSNKSVDGGKSANGAQSPSGEASPGEMSDGYRANMQLLTKVPLFQRLPKNQHPVLAQACESRKFIEGRIIVKEGEIGSEFFVIKEGEAAVLLEGREVAPLGPGDYFGESALLRHEPRMVTVRAKTDIVALRITRNKFQELHLHKHLSFANRKAVGAARTVTDDKSVKSKPPTPKTAEERQSIIEALRRNENLKVIPSLCERRMGEMADVAWTETVPKDRQLITQGDVVADYMYVVKSGSFEILLKDKADVTAYEPRSAECLIMTRRKSTTIGEIQAGGSFGELALLYSAPRAATIVAKQESVVWVIDRTNFKDILKKENTEKVEKYVKYLDSVELLQRLTPAERQAVAGAMHEVHFRKGDKVLQQGDTGSTFYILCEGEVSVVKDGVEQVKLKASSAEGVAQYFGERALLNKEPRAATITVTSETATAMELDQQSFNILLGPLEEIFKRRTGPPPACSSCFAAFPMPWKPKRPAPKVGLELTKDQALALSSQSGQGSSAPSSEKRRINRQELKKVGLLGAGAFGVVELYEHQPTGETYAMKSVSKGSIVKMGMKESIMNERLILSMINSQFIIALHETYNGPQQLCFLLEPALGGELHSTYIRKDFYGRMPHAKYYIGSIVYAFEHLHERRIIYRDLKPENLLINDRGHLKVTDMGLSKFVIGKTFTTCGTPDYFAPEVIASTGHTHAVDWWTLGILMYELLTAHPPFVSPQPLQTFAKILAGIGNVSFPSTVAGASGDLIKEMLQKDPSQRLPVRPGQTKNLKDHPWYQGFNWDALRALKMEPPYNPKVKSKTDLANFSVRQEDLPEQVHYQDDNSGWDKDFASS